MQKQESISESELYTVAELCSRLRVSQQTIAKMRRDGLKIRRIGNRPVVLGRDLILHLECESQEVSIG